MTSSYLGIVSPHGLELLQPEHEHLARFLLRRAYGRRVSHSLCCWAVLHRQQADVIQQLIRTGYPYKALLMLNILAVDLGTLLPDTTADSDLFATCG